MSRDADHVTIVLNSFCTSKMYVQGAIKLLSMAKTVALFLMLLFHTAVKGETPPNIIFILADDLGWDDVSFHGSEIKTPNIDKLAQEGVILNNYYVQPICTPTRGALLSGRYPIHTGLQHYVIAGSQPYGLPLTEVTIPQHLKKLGYSTHAVGKWHLGFYKKDYLPENRGFDTHYGYYLGKGDFFDHYSEDGGYMGYDFHHNGETVWNQSEIYSTEIFTERAVSLIESHDKSQPLFLYLAHQAVHVGNKNDKIQPLQKDVARFPYIKDVKRKLFAGVASALDDSVGLVYKAVQAAGMADNTVIIFSTDNGGPANGYDGNAACNWPLRGTKNTLWQGGVRGVGFVHSPLLEKQSYINPSLMHVSDWLPTIVNIAGGNTSSLGNIDGLNQWEVISQNASASRNEVLLNIDPIMKHEALIVGDFKIIYGDISGGRDDGWYPPPHIHLADTEISSMKESDNDFDRRRYLNEYFGQDNKKSYFPSKDASEIHQSDVVDLIKFMNEQYSKVKQKHLESKSQLFSSLLFSSEKPSKSDLLSSPQTSYHSEGNEGLKIMNDPRSVIIKCGAIPQNASTNCQPEKAACLFHLRDDPCEYNNLADEMPQVVKMLQDRIEFYRKTMIPPGNKPEDPKGNPQLHGGVWVPWL